MAARCCRPPAERRPARRAADVDIPHDRTSTSRQQGYGDRRQPGTLVCTSTDASVTDGHTAHHPNPSAPPVPTGSPIGPAPRSGCSAPRDRPGARRGGRDSRARAAPTGRRTCSASSCSATPDSPCGTGSGTAATTRSATASCTRRSPRGSARLAVGIASSVIAVRGLRRPPPAATSARSVRSPRVGSPSARRSIWPSVDSRSRSGSRSASSRSSAYERRWIVLGLVAAPLTSLASPVAGVFLAIGLCGIVIDAVAPPAQRRTRAVHGPDRDGGPHRRPRSPPLRAVPRSRRVPVPRGRRSSG